MAKANADAGRRSGLAGWAAAMIGHAYSPWLVVRPVLIARMAPRHCETCGAITPDFQATSQSRAPGNSHRPRSVRDLFLTLRVRSLSHIIRPTLPASVNTGKSVAMNRNRITNPTRMEPPHSLPRCPLATTTGARHERYSRLGHRTPDHHHSLTSPTWSKAHSEKCETVFG